MPWREKSVAVGFIGFTGCLIARVHGVLFDTLGLQLLLGAFLVVFSIGAMMMCYAVFKAENRTVKLLMLGSYGVLGLIAIEIIVSWLFKGFLGIALYPITAWYAIPCVVVFLLGLICLVIDEVKYSSKRTTK